MAASAAAMSAGCTLSRPAASPGWTCRASAPPATTALLSRLGRLAIGRPRHRLRRRDDGGGGAGDRRAARRKRRPAGVDRNRPPPGLAVVRLVAAADRLESAGAVGFDRRRLSRARRLDP